MSASDVEADRVAAWLLEKNFLLTALELRQELLETDSQVPQPLVQAFDPSKLPRGPSVISEAASKGHVRSPSGSSNPIVTPTANSVPNLTRQLKEKDEQLALVRYQLSIAQEDLKELKQQLVAASQHNKTAVESTVGTTSTTSETQGNQTEIAPIEPQEFNVLNYIIEKYLRQNNLNLTAITLAQEAGSDLDNWEQIGVKSTQPPNLLALSRFYFSKSKDVFLEYQARLESSERERNVLQHLVNDTKEKLVQSENSVLVLKKEKQDLQAKLLESLEEIKRATFGASLPTTTAHTVAVEQRPLTTEVPQPSSGPTVSAAAPPAAEKPVSWQLKYRNSRREKNSVEIRNVMKSDGTSRISQAVKLIGDSSESDNKTAVLLFAECLPNIVPNVLFSKRDELIPVLLCVIRSHPEQDVRFKLSRLLFNFIKQPNELQRSIIMEGCVSLASLIGPSRTMSELLNHCWEQVSAKHEERRILVADSCGSLAPYTNPDIRPTIIYSILQKLIEDKSPAVRSAVTRNFGALATYLKDSEKYPTTQDILVRFLKDSDQGVVQSTQKYLLPAVADWADVENILTHPNGLLSCLLSDIHTTLTKAGAGSADKPISDSVVHVVDIFITSFSACVPHLHEYVLLSVPGAAAPPDIVSGTLDKEFKATLVEQLNTFLLRNEHPPNVPRSGIEPLDWLTNHCITKLIEIVDMTPTGDSPLLRSIIKMMSSVSKSFGQAFTKKVLMPLFNAALIAELPKEKSSLDVNPRKSRLLPVYLCSIIANIGDEVLIGTTRDLLQAMADKTSGWNHNHFPALKTAVIMLCTKNSEKQNVVMSMLHELASSRNANVRVYVTYLCTAVIPLIQPPELVMTHIVPSLITLSSDPERSVRRGCIAALGAASICPVPPDNKEIGNKLVAALQVLAEDRAGVMRLELCQTFRNIIPYVSDNFRAFILKQLVAIAAGNNEAKVEKERGETGQALFEAFRAFNGCTVDEDAIEKFILPGLKFLLNDTPYMESGFKPLITNMISELDALIHPTQPGTGTKSTKTWSNILKFSKKT
ncbi:RAB11-binding protein RELCH [Pelomyxa schiedti]|nr:RAB11-binding protein RELCH [Pelomyxa schiedti]